MKKNFMIHMIITLINSYFLKEVSKKESSFLSNKKKKILIAKFLLTFYH